VVQLRQVSLYHLFKFGWISHTGIKIFLDNQKWKCNCVLHEGALWTKDKLCNQSMLQVSVELESWGITFWHAMMIGHGSIILVYHMRKVQARESLWFTNRFDYKNYLVKFFLAHLAKGNVSFCHHLASVVCHLFTFHILIFSSENLQPNELELGRKHLWKDLSKECTFCYDPLPNIAATGNSCFWLANLKKSSPLKPLGQMNRNLVGNIYGMSSMKIAHFVTNG
jgi:hypothetical protein